MLRPARVGEVPLFVEAAAVQEGVGRPNLVSVTGATFPELDSVAVSLATAREVEAEAWRQFTLVAVTDLGSGVSGNQSQWLTVRAIRLSSV